MKKGGNKIYSAHCTLIFMIVATSMIAECPSVGYHVVPIIDSSFDTLVFLSVSVVSACASSFPSYTSDVGLTVANGTYAITANRCVQCSCGPDNMV
jgi:hypothetical protein